MLAVRLAVEGGLALARVPAVWAAEARTVRLDALTGRALAVLAFALPVARVRDDVLAMAGVSLGSGAGTMAATAFERLDRDVRVEVLAAFFTF